MSDDVCLLLEILKIFFECVTPKHSLHTCGRYRWSSTHAQGEDKRHDVTLANQLMNKKLQHPAKMPRRLLILDTVPDFTPFLITRRYRPCYSRPGSRTSSRMREPLIALK